MCDSEMKSKGLLNAHLRSHNERFTCDICGESFLQKLGLENHINPLLQMNLSVKTVLFKEIVFLNY